MAISPYSAVSGRHSYLRSKLKGKQKLKAGEASRAIQMGDMTRMLRTDIKESGEAARRALDVPWEREQDFSMDNLLLGGLGLGANILSYRFPIAGGILSAGVAGTRAYDDMKSQAAHNVKIAENALAASFLEGGGAERWKNTFLGGSAQDFETKTKTVYEDILSGAKTQEADKDAMKQIALEHAGKMALQTIVTAQLTKGITKGIGKGFEKLRAVKGGDALAKTLETTGATMSDVRAVGKKARMSIAGAEKAGIAPMKLESFKAPGADLSQFTAMEQSLIEGLSVDQLAALNQGFPMPLIEMLLKDLPGKGGWGQTGMATALKQPMLNIDQSKARVQQIMSLLGSGITAGEDFSELLKAYKGRNK